MFDEIERIGFWNDIKVVEVEPTIIIKTEVKYDEVI